MSACDNNAGGLQSKTVETAIVLLLPEMKGLTPKSFTY